MEDDSEMLNVANAAAALGLEELDPDWVSDVFNEVFLSTCDLPPDYYESSDMIEVYMALKAVCGALDAWIINRTWVSLSRELPCRPLLAFLYHLVDYGKRNMFILDYRNNALLASQVYCKLLAVPGFQAYSIYHSHLFTACLSCLGFPKLLCENDESRLSARERAHEVNHYNRQLSSFLEDLNKAVSLLELTSEEPAFEEMLNHMIDLTALLVNDKLRLDPIELSEVSKRAHDIINSLLMGKDGNLQLSGVRALYKCILPKLVSASTDSRASSRTMRSWYVLCCGSLLSRYGKPALFSFNILLQHLCYTLDGLERAEVRKARAELVVGLMSLLPKKAYQKFVDWMLVLSTTPKMAHRVIAVDIFARLLNGDETSEPLIAPSDPSTSAESMPPAAESTSGGLMQNDAEDEDSQSSQGEHSVKEEDAAVLTAQTHTVPVLKILQAVHERANDVSSSVRVPALALLKHCVTSWQPALTNAVSKLNENSELMVLAVKCMGDERALVRKSAIALLDAQLRSDETLLTKNNLGVLAGLCRDTSVMVRSTAVTTLGQLMQQWPRDGTFDAFLAGPMRQLKDPEPKVQELILKIVSEVVFEKLTTRSATCLQEHHTPWMFVAAVARHNMRRHLQAVCAMLAKSTKCINHSLVDKISTHMGAESESDLNSLVLLSGVARHVDYHNVDFLLDYYYQMSDDVLSRDARLLPLLLEVLMNWSHLFTADQRATLRTHLIQVLQSGNCGSEGSRRLCATLAAHLDPGDIGWASQFLQAYERRALEGAPVSEWVCAADMTLVAPEQPSDKLVQLFISTVATFHKPHPELSEAAQGCVVAGLGRICVRSRTVAALAAPVLARLLGAPHAPISVRVNSLLVLSDLCRRYTGIVEQLQGDMCMCLEDRQPQLRRAAVRAITRLLLNEYLRLCAPLYYRYCALLADADPEVREPAEYYVTSVLTPETISKHFFGCLMYYNRCSAAWLEPAYDSRPPAREHCRAALREDSLLQEINMSESRGDESEDDSLSVQLKRTTTSECLKFDSRQLIYDIMLQRMTAEQRIYTQCLLANKLLVHAANLADEEQLLTPSIQSAIVDTLAVLRGPHMRLPRKPTEMAANIDELGERLTSNIISQKMKMTVAHDVVPAVIRLYARLSNPAGRGTVVIGNVKSGDDGAAGGSGKAGGSSAVGDHRSNDDSSRELVSSLVRLASDLLKDYKQEIEQLILNDPELMEDIVTFQEKVGEEPSFRNTRNIVLHDRPDTDPTPFTKDASRRRRMPHRKYQATPAKRVLRY